MSNFERLGSTDPNAEREAQKATRETLEDIKEEIGADVYEAIIGKLSTGDINDLNEEERSIIARIRQEKGGVTH